MENRYMISVGIVLTMSFGVDMQSDSCSLPKFPCGNDCCSKGDTCGWSGEEPKCRSMCLPGCSSNQHCCKTTYRSVCCESYEACTDGVCDPSVPDTVSDLTDDNHVTFSYPSFELPNPPAQPNYDDHEIPNDDEYSSSSSGSGSYVYVGGGAGGGGFIIICCICVRRRRRVVRLTRPGTTTVVTRTARVMVPRRANAAGGASNTGPMRVSANSNQVPMSGRGTVVIIACQTTGARPVNGLGAPKPASAAQAGQPGGGTDAPPAYAEVAGGGQPGRPEQPPPYSDFRVVGDKERLCDETE